MGGKIYQGINQEEIFIHSILRFTESKNTSHPIILYTIKIVLRYGSLALNNSIKIIRERSYYQLSSTYEL